MLSQCNWSWLYCHHLHIFYSNNSYKQAELETCLTECDLDRWINFVFQDFGYNLALWICLVEFGRGDSSQKFSKELIFQLRFSADGEGYWKCSGVKLIRYSPSWAHSAVEGGEDNSDRLYLLQRKPPNSSHDVLVLNNAPHVNQKFWIKMAVCVDWWRQWVKIRLLAIGLWIVRAKLSLNTRIDLLEPQWSLVTSLCLEDKAFEVVGIHF